MLPCCPNIESSWSNREVGTILYLCSWPLGREGRWSSVTGTMAPPPSWYQLNCTRCLCEYVSHLSSILPKYTVYCILSLWVICSWKCVQYAGHQILHCLPDIKLLVTAGGYQAWWHPSRAQGSCTQGASTLLPQILHCTVCLLSQSVHCCTLPRPVPDIRSHRAPAAPTVQPTSPDHRGLVPRLGLQQPPA